jgi:acyl phosphate:glycerol-3-phosphate acyltransferase
LSALHGTGLVLFAFLLGGIPFSYLAGRLSRGVDLRELGSGNLGATNAMREFGWPWGVTVLLLDAAKGWAAVALSLHFAGPGWLTVLVGLSAVLGHSFTPYLGFKGGKGVATSTGVFLTLAPAVTGLALLIFLLAMFTVRRVAVGSLAAATAMPLFILWLHPGEASLLAFGIFIALLIWVRHRSNLLRLFRGEEPRFSLSRKGEH